jgi:hypothetical protein
LMESVMASFVLVPDNTSHRTGASSHIIQYAALPIEFAQLGAQGLIAEVMARASVSAGVKWETMGGLDEPNGRGGQHSLTAVVQLHTLPLLVPLDGSPIAQLRLTRGVHACVRRRGTRRCCGSGARVTAMPTTALARCQWWLANRPGAVLCCAVLRRRRQRVFPSPEYSGRFLL